jgi:hypothetical protein
MPWLVREYHLAVLSITLIVDPFGLCDWERVIMGGLDVTGGVLLAGGVMALETVSAGLVSVVIPTVFLTITHGMVEV